MHYAVARDRKSLDSRKQLVLSSLLFGYLAFRITHIWYDRMYW